MIQPDLIAYLKQMKEEGYSLESVKPILLQQGWVENDINESSMALSAPVAPSFSSISKVLPQKKEKKIPDYYVSPISILLAIVLFLSLYSLTGQILNDIESVVAPYAARTVRDTPAYQALSEKYSRNIPATEMLRVETMWSTHNKKDRINHLFIVGIVSAVFWVVAFAIHHVIGESRRHFLPLSIPFFLTAGAYLVSALFDIIARLFEKDAQWAVYTILILFIVIMTVAFMFYQKRSHAEKQL
ncbi:MAG: hypothetical protein O3A36_02255 [bacterium]|nr:hypothetical protein [bacterium]